MWEFPSWFPWWFEKAAPGNGAPKADADAMEQKRAEQWAVATMAVLGNYVMPILTDCWAPSPTSCAATTIGWRRICYRHVTSGQIASGSCSAC